MSDPLTDLLENLDRARKGIKTIKDLRDDVKKALDVIDTFNKNANSMVRTLERLARVLERNEDIVKKLVSKLEDMDKNFKAFANMLSLLSEEEKEGRR